MRKKENNKYLQKTSKIFFVCAFLSLFSIVYSGDVITSLDFWISPTAQTAKINDTIFFNMCVLDASQIYSNVSQVVSVTNTSIVIASANFPAMDPNPAAPLWIYNGINTWRIVTPYINSSIKSVELNNTNLWSGRPVSNYTSIQYSTFYGASGVPSTGGVAKIDIGTTIVGLIILYDDGNLTDHNDTQANDGRYNNKFILSEMYKINVINGAIVGHYSKSGLNATNAPFIAPNTINIDGIRPKIELVNVNPNPFNPFKNFAQFFYYLSENSDVTLKIFYGNTTITALDIAGYFGYNNPILWDGRSNTGSIQTDGNYSYRFDYVDKAGNRGVPFTGFLKITTVDLTTFLYSIDTQYSHTDASEIVVLIQMGVELRNATFNNLRNLGFDYPESFGSHDYRNYPYTLLDLRVYKSDGTACPAGNMPRDMSGWDTDYYFIDINQPRFFDNWPMTGFTYNPLPVNPCAVTNTVIYTLPDKDVANDWDNVFIFPLIDNGNGFFYSNPSYIRFQKDAAPGTYIVTFKAKLVGKSIFNVSKELEKGTIKCGETDIEYYYYRYHAQPSFFFDESTGYHGGIRGYGLTSDEKTASYMVEPKSTVPIPDNYPPIIVAYSNYPSNGQTIAPGIIGPNNYLRITVVDDGVGAGPINLSSFVLKDPYGNQVPGRVAWNAGIPGTKTWELYYIPDKSLTLGGLYTYSVTPVDAAYNIGQTRTYSFIIADTSIPLVTNVSVQSSTGNSEQLSSSSSRQITFIISKIQVTIIPGGTASNVDWKNSNISVRNSVGNYVSGTVLHQPNTNILEFIPTNEIGDGSYTVIITAVSDSGYQGAYSYSFYVTTANVIYINLAGTGENDTTVMRISQFNAISTGITSRGVDVDPTDFSAVSLNAASLPALPANYNLIGTPIRFNLTGHSFPVYFNKNFCSVIIRVHYTDADVATLSALGLNESNLTLWYYNGTNWQQITNFGGPVDNPISPDRYLYIDITSMTSPVIHTSSNIYAIMYVPPAIPPVAYNFKNTKSFNPTKETAKILYTTDIGSIGSLGGTGNVKVYIFSLTGSIIRTLEYQDINENVLFNNYEIDPANPAVRYYYVSWDGKNDHGTIVKNGIYVVKIEITTITGKKTTKSRTIAVIK